MEGVDREIDALREFRPGVVALSGHDSSDEAIERFREAFGPAYRDLRVGEKIAVPT
jgi:7,8-dihydropterin-6-yl-methyl-4-(beta-D-ribofuranosyl)aminobenzene 5'-phosphate synthase